MTSQAFLLVVALVQGILLAALVILIILSRWVRLRRRAQVHPRRVQLDEAMQRWATGGGAADTAVVLQRLAAVPVPLAIDALVSWSARVPGERWHALAAGLEQQWWARLVRANVGSARWWKRVECARFLSVAATQADIPRVLKLLRDPRPAVHIAAVASLERLESAELVAAALERLPRLVPTIQAYYAAMLRKSRPIVVRTLLTMLQGRGGAGLPRVAEFAARLEDPALREPLTNLADHRDAEVRTQVARALGGYPHPASVATLTRLAQDGEWTSRAQAMRSLGRIADPRTLPLVRGSLQDGEAWVRLRAALALTRFGPAGRNALLEAEVGAHPGARDVAKLVLGLSPQALMEFAA